MKKTALFLLALTLLTTSCGSIVARKDKSQIVKFENTKIVSGKYDITFYRINYPNTPYEKDKFYEDFDVLTSKMVAYGKDINLIIPLELYKDLKNLQKREVRESEKVFYKQSYSLTDEEKAIIDNKVKVKTPQDSGSVQEYLNKQVAYWYDYLKKPEMYEADKHYTELDKDRIVDEVFENRKFFSNTCFAIEDDYVIEVDEDELLEGSELGFPLYLNSNTLPKERLANLKSKVFIIEGEVEDSVIPEKILLIDNKTVENVKDYELTTKIIDIDNPLKLIPTVDEYQDLKIKEIKNFSIKYVPNSTLNKATIREESKPRETIKFRESQTKWGIE